MSRISVRLSSGQIITAEVPRVFSIEPPRPVEEARRDLAVHIARQVEPHIKRRPSIQEVIRDSDGRIAGLREFEGDRSRRELAWEAGVRLAREIVPEDEP